VTALIDAQRPAGAHMMLHGDGYRRGRALGIVTVLSRALPRRDARHSTPDELTLAFVAVRDEVLQLADRARAAMKQRCPALEEMRLSLEDSRLEERAHEHLANGVAPALALERIAGEVARALAGQGPAARRAVDIEAFLGAVAHRLSGIEAQRMRRGELLVSVHLPGLQALRGWAAGATGAVCAMPAADSTGAEILTALGLPVVSGVRQVFGAVTHGERIALDGDSGEIIINPSATQSAEFRR
ncbi:MAG TPA: hypothetical protein VLW85_24115, partial [Myxococcales bacterium]|nr:hypothetical protein [Myxococcales bacterium]